MEFVGVGTSGVSLALGLFNTTQISSLKNDINSLFTAQNLIKNKQGEIIDTQGRLVDTQGRLVNKQGQLVDVQGRLVNKQQDLIDEQGRLVNTQGQLINTQGKLVDEQGRIITRQELLTDTQGGLVNKQGELVDTQGRLVNQQDELINKQGQLVDTQGRLVNKQNELINTQGQLVDTQGRLVDQQGELINTQGHLVRLQRDAAPSVPSPSAPLQIPELTAVENTLIPSSSPDITEIHQHLDFLQTAVNDASSAILVTSANVGTKANELAELGQLVQGETSLLRGLLSENEAGIGENKNNILNLSSTVQGGLGQAKDGISTVMNDLDSFQKAVDGETNSLRGLLSENEAAIGENKNNILHLSSTVQTGNDQAKDGISTVMNNLDSLQIAVEGETGSLRGLLSENEAAILNLAGSVTALANDAGFLAEKFLRSGDDILCNGLLRANNGAEIALQKMYLRMFHSNNDKYMIYAASGNAAKGPSGNAPAKGFGYAGDSIRMRTADSANAGFIVENSSEKMLLSVRGSDGLTACAGPLVVDTKCSISSDANFAYFSHKDYEQAERYAFAQHNNGLTVVNSPNSILLRLKGTNMLQVEATQVTVEKQLKVNHPAGINDTFFGVDSNRISTGAGKRTYFAFGADNASVNIRHKEVNIAGTDVLAKLTALENRIKLLEDEDTIKNREVIYLKNGENSKYVRKASSSNDIVCDNDKGKVGTKDRFTLERR